MLELHEVFNRARWAQNSPNTWLLKCTSKDGGWVLASAETNGTGFVCEVGGVRWACRGFWTVARSVRAALRDARWERAVSADDIQSGQMFVELADGSRWVEAQ